MKKQSKAWRASAIAAVIGWGLTGCATNPATGEPYISFSNIGQNVETGLKSVYDSSNPCSNNDRNIGITAGAILGVVIAHETGSKGVGDLIGAVIGGGIGGLIGHEIDARRCAIYKIAKQHGMRLVSATITRKKLGITKNGKPRSRTIGLDVQIQDQGQQGDQFIPGTATLTPQAKAGLVAIAQEYTPKTIVASAGKAATPQMMAQAAQRKILIVGHTDHEGNAVHAAQLSEERARAVALVFASQGVPANDIYYQGAGGTLPMVSNATALGREENRRVQIVDVPSTTDLRQYLTQRVADPANFARTKATEKTAPGVVTSAGGNHSGPATKSISYAAPAPRVAVASDRYNFGGAPASHGKHYINLGTPVSRSMFRLIESAQAAEPIIIPTCKADNPRLATPVRNLATGRYLSIRQALPGFYGAPWVGMVNGNLVAILHPYAPKATGAPVPRPDLQIYRDYATLHEKYPTFSRYVPVDVYWGSKAVVYRLFVGGPIQCMDLVDPLKNPVSAGRLYYDNGPVEYVARTSFELRQ
ncbi:MAG: OmpA family protein [Gammaproteobacteria bacterium]|nr:OmpA family protein [Gammaproteobacteria bacterium]